MKYDSALKALVSFFTVFHLDIGEDDMEAMDKGFHLVPLLGALFGVVTWAIASVALAVESRLGMGSGLLAGVLCLAAVYIGSKFLHFDGLTDFGDGIVVSGPQEKHVHALKDSLVGAGGIGTALTVVLLTVGVYSATPIWMLLMAIPIVEVLVKYAMVVAAAFGKPGNGMAGRQVELTTQRSALVAMILSMLLSILFWELGNATIRLFGLYVFHPLDAVWAMLFGILAATIVGYVMARIANREFGMVNGDVLGATNEVSRFVVLFTIVLLMYVML